MNDVKAFQELVALHKQAIEEHEQMLKKHLNEEQQAFFYQHLAIIEDWLDKIGEVKTLLVPLLAAKHGLNVAEECIKLIESGETL